MYKIFDDGINAGVIDLGRNVFIPSAPVLADDWQEYQSWLAKGNTPLPDDINTLPNLQKSKEADIRAKYGESMEDIVKPYTTPERETWFLQVKEAEAYQVNSAALTPLLDAIATANGTTKDALAASVTAKNAAFIAAVGGLLGTQQRLLAAVYAATTIAEVNAVEI